MCEFEVYTEKVFGLGLICGYRYHRYFAFEYSPENESSSLALLLGPHKKGGSERMISAELYVLEFEMLYSPTHPLC